jgi:RHS repeat-associated protein
MLMPGRKFDAGSSYRYGFNGKENDSEMYGDGNAYDFGARMYNPRIGRWFSADAKGKAFSSPYNYVQNNPINRVDPDGNDDIYFVFLYDKTIPSLSHLTKFSVIVRNNEPNRYIHRTYFLTSGKGGITDQVLSAPRDK